MVKLIGMLSRFSPVNVLVIGDFMLDTYTTGKVKRISPEAPVSILHVQKEQSLPGGAGNVALNVTSLGAKVYAVGRIGRDNAGDLLRESLEKEGVNIEGLIYQKGFKTPVKNRLIADSQQVLRVDFETISHLPLDMEEKIAAVVFKHLEHVQIVAISDYGKGLLSTPLLAKIISRAKERGLAIIVDPKGDDFSKYSGASIIKPNLSEAFAAAKLSPSASLVDVAASLIEKSGAESLLITRSEAGMSLFSKGGGCIDFPVRSKEVKDVTGAGDTVLAMLSVALANHLDVKIAIQLSNIAAGLAIERLGCARINLSDLSERMLELDIDNKIFDEEHLFALQQALKGKRYSVLGVDSHQGMSTLLFKSIKKLSARDAEMKLIVYVTDSGPGEEFVSLLASLAEVDFIVLKNESLRNLCEIIHPHQVYVIDDGKLVLLDHATALLTRVKDTAGALREGSRSV